MTVKKVIRFVSSIAALSCAMFLAVDFAFVLIAPALRGTFVYAGVQALFQSLIIMLMAKRVIVIFC